MTKSELNTKYIQKLQAILDCHSATDYTDIEDQEDRYNCIVILEFLEDIKNLNEATVKREKVCVKCQGTGQIPYSNFAGTIMGSTPCNCTFNKT